LTDINSKGTVLIIVGFIILFLGWLSLITGIIGVAVAEDIKIFVEVEDMIFVLKEISAGSIQLQMFIRILFGFIFIFIGNSFMVQGFQRHRGIEQICHPRIQDFNRGF
jgi:hypothetical protein